MPNRKDPNAASPDARAALRLLTALAQSTYSLSLEDLMRENAMTLTATRRSLELLAEEGFAAVDPGSGRYRVGVKFLRLLKNARGSHLLEHEIQPIMRELAAEAGETVTLNTYEPGATFALCVLVEDSPAPLHYAVEVGEMKPLHAGASGKAILAYLPDDAVDAYIEQTGLPAITPRTITDREKLWREIRRIRKRGYTISRGQRLEGAVAVAGSVFRPDNRIYASLVLTIPSDRYRRLDPTRIAALVTDAARRISTVLAAHNE